MSTAVHHHLAVESEVTIGVRRPDSGGIGFVVTLDSPGAVVTVFMTREQLVALHAASSLALSRPDNVKALMEGSRNGH